MEPLVVQLLPGSEPARNEERVHRRPVLEAVVREHREASLRLDGTHRVRDQERFQLRIEAARHREHAVGRREVDDLHVLENVDAKPEARYAQACHDALLG